MTHLPEYHYVPYALIGNLNKVRAFYVNLSIGFAISARDGSIIHNIKGPMIFLDSIQTLPYVLYKGYYLGSQRLRPIANRDTKQSCLRSIAKYSSNICFGMILKSKRQLFARKEKQDSLIAASLQILLRPSQKTRMTLQGEVRAYAKLFNKFQSCAIGSNDHIL